MTKYIAVYLLSLQQELYYRASFLMDRARSITILIAFYSFWSALFQGRDEFIGFTKSQMLTYVLGMNILRAAIFSDTTWELICEINTGKISSYLIRPVSYLDTASAATWPTNRQLRFSHSRNLPLSGFSKSLSHPAKYIDIHALPFPSPLPCCSIFHELHHHSLASDSGMAAPSSVSNFSNSAGFFSLSTFSRNIAKYIPRPPVRRTHPFPSERLSQKFTAQQYMQGLAIQIFWTIVMGLIAKQVWTRGLKSYTAEGG